MFSKIFSKFLPKIFREKTSLKIKEEFKFEEGSVRLSNKYLQDEKYLFLSFEIPADKTIGNEVGGHILLSKKGHETRQFYPISRQDQLGSFDILCELVKNEQKEIIGSFSQIIEKSNKNEEFQLSKAQYKYKYFGFGEFELNDEKRGTHKIKNVRSVLLFAQNTNVTSFFQFIESSINLKNETLHISLFYSFDDMQSVPLIQEIASWAQEKLICLECFESNKDSFYQRKLDLESVEGYVTTNEKQIFLVSGRHQFFEDVKSILCEGLKVDQDTIWRI